MKNNRERFYTELSKAKLKFIKFIDVMKIL